MIFYNKKKQHIIYFVYFIALSNEERKLQKTDLQFNKTYTARHIKITIVSGYDSFASIHHVNIDGKAPR